MKKTFINGRVVTPDEVLSGYQVVVKKGKIVEISKFDGNQKKGEKYIDLDGAILMPGLIDIHSDMIENILQPRTTSLMDFSMGLYEAERQLAACGITTIFHSIAMFREGNWDTKEIRLPHNVERLAKLIHQMKGKPHLINNYHHLRYEIDNVECFENIVNLINADCVQLLSLMDHTPGQGQYKDLSIYRCHLPGEGKNLTDEEFDTVIKRELEKEVLSEEKRKELIDLASSRLIPVASHDDDSVEMIDLNEKLGITISEFPITLEAAKHAKGKRMYTLLGAPNVLRGKSHSGNLSAIEAIQEGVGDILCSDYYPQALLRSIFILCEKNVLPLHEAVKLVTLNPAKATGMGECKGSIEVGKDADLIVVREEENQILMIAAYVDGRSVMRTKYIGG